MAAKVIMPKQGLQMTEGNIIEWLASEGDRVEEGQPLFEMETDKLTITIDAPASGTLLRILHGEGSVVPITHTIAVIGKEGEDISGIVLEAQAEENSSGAPSPSQKSEEPKKPVATSSSVVAPGRTFSTPRARWTAEETGVDLATVEPTGPDSLVIERDVLAAAETVKPSSLGGRVSGDRKSPVHRPRPSTDREDRIVPLTGMRGTIARRMRESLDSAAQAVHRISVDMSEVVRMRDKLKDAGREVSYNDIVVRATALVLQHHPRMNSVLTDDGIVELGSVNLGIAVAMPEGLIVPVLRDADLLDLESIHSESKRLSEGARQGALAPQELEGGTFSVSNLGMYGLDSFTAIIDTPQSGILAVGAIKDRIVPLDGVPVVRPVCELSLTYDHRVIDGAPAADFLRELADLLENPYLLA
jgi:pyruvate dehydrogenase E2 component (dihydrolipoamide acetyltransferase)